MNNSYKTLIKNSLWTLMGNTGSKILSFLLLPFYTRWLGTEGYGLSDLITTYSSFLIGLVTLCVADGIFIFTKNRTKKEKSEYYTSTLKFVALLFVIWAVFFVIVEWVATTYNIHNSFTDHLWLIAAFILSNFLQSYTQQFLIGIEKIKLYSATGMVLCITTFALSFLIIPTYGVIGYVYSLFISNIFTALFSFIVSGSYRYFSIRCFDWNKVRELLAYSIPLIPNAIMWWLVSALNRPLMEKYLTLSDIGIYAVANKFPGIISMVFSIFVVSWNISVLEEYHKPTFRIFYERVFRVLFVMMGVLTLGLIFSSKLIVSVFAAQQFADAWRFMSLLVLGSFFSCLSSFFGSVFGVVKQSKYYFYSSIYGATVSIVLNCLLIPTIGLTGACISVILSFFAMALSRYFFSKKFVNCAMLKEVLFYSVVLVAFVIVFLFDNTLYINVIALIISMLLLLYKERAMLSQIKTILASIRK